MILCTDKHIPTNNTITRLLLASVILGKNTLAPLLLRVSKLTPLLMCIYLIKTVS